MNNSIKNLSEVLSVWNEKNSVKSDGKFQPALITDIVASFFCPGEYYYFILNFFNLDFEYVHPTIENVLGCSAKDFKFEYIFEKMHPEDAPKINLKEATAIDFFYKKITREKIPFYKSTYSFRVDNGNGGWKHILHQSIALKISDEGIIHYALSVHSDITFLNPFPDDSVSFIGINGEPSYYKFSINDKDDVKESQAIKISNREKDIIRLLANGLSSKQIADELFLSKHTVDTHRRNLLKKTGTKNTLELTALCLKMGLI